MKVRGLYVENFRAITTLSMESLEDTVVIAGPNGCGKSCIFDAVRLSKSVYEGYQQNEWHQWFSEFQININRLDRDVTTLFQDKDRPVVIQLDFELTEHEREFIIANIGDLVTETVWQSVLPERGGRRRNLMPAAEMRRYQPRVDSETAERLRILEPALANRLHRAEIRIDPNGDILAEPSPVLELCFSTYDPENIGIVDYHGAKLAIRAGGNGRDKSQH